jgi:hypothetical protein
MHYAAVSLVGLQVSNESTLLLSLAVDRLRTVLAVKGSLRRAEDGAPLTAPGRSEEPYLIRRERRIGKSMTLTAQHLATFNRRDHVRATKPRGTCTAAGGWMPKISRRPARGRDFSLDIPFYRTGWFSPKDRPATVIRVFIDLARNISLIPTICCQETVSGEATRTVRYPRRQSIPHFEFSPQLWLTAEPHLLT